MANDELLVWTIYERPLDYPNGYVVRAYECSRGEPVPWKTALFARTLESARAMLPAGLYRIGRSVDDDPKIVESWL